MCRYDVALDVNVTGVKHMCVFAKKCPNLEVLLHVSTGTRKLTTCLQSLSEKNNHTNNNY